MQSWSDAEKIHYEKDKTTLVHQLANLHRQVIWTLLIANLKARKVRVLDGKAVCLLKVLYN